MPRTTDLVVEAFKETTSLTDSPRTAPASDFSVDRTEMHTME
ncbi:hypothetical protein ACF09Y_25970 [Streptomyces massasporeus]|nr:hypothetical protein [Streptomyces sp. WAC04114]